MLETTIPYKEQKKHKSLYEYDVYTNEELKEAHYDPETIQVIKELEKESSINAHTSTNNKGTVRETNKMPTIKEAAQQYTPQTTHNIADLQEVNIESMALEDREGTDQEGNPFKYKVIVVNGEDYRVPGSVIGSIKGILEKKPDLKRISVSKSGQGMQTRYTVIPLE